jgi:hypothetical protein
MEDTETISVDRVVLREVEALARETGLSVEEIVHQALEQGIMGLRSAQFFSVRRGKGNLAEALALLRAAGAGKPPIPGDEIPDEVKALYPELQDR